jgi:hypothetical protein
MMPKLTKEEKKRLRKKYENQLARESWGDSAFFDGAVRPERLVLTGDPRSMWAKFPYFRGPITLVAGQRLIIVDPFYIARIDTSTGVAASYLRKNGVVLFEFGGDFSGAVYWAAPYLVIPKSDHYQPSPSGSAGSAVLLSDRIGCDHGCLVMLPETAEFPDTLFKKIATLLNQGLAAAIEPPRGTYSFFYEQFYSPSFSRTEMYRNIVAHNQSLRSYRRPWWKFW